jgi:broad specificity phosphatase PhoE
VLVLVRHGQTTANASGLLLGRADLPLTEVGRRQAQAIAATVRGAARVVSSPLKRALETAGTFSDTVEIDERWVEVDYGEYDMLPLRDVPDDIWARWRADPEFAPPGGESFTSVERRVRMACEDLMEQAAREDVVVVSHVSPIKEAVAWALGVSGTIAWRMHLDVAGISRVTCGLRGPSLRSFNETGHLRVLDG